MKQNYSRDLPSGLLIRETIFKDGKTSTQRLSQRTGIESQQVVRGLTANWKERKKILPLPMNNYQLTVTEYRFGSGGIAFQDFSTGTKVFTSGEIGATTSAPGTSTGPVSGINNALDAMDRSAIIALRNKLKDMKINVAQFYAEREQVSRMLSETAIKMAKAINNLKSFNYAGAAKNLGLHVSPRSRKQKGFKKHLNRVRVQQEQEIARAWLQLGYGWLPLISDAKGAAETLAKANNRFFIGKASHTAKRVFYEEKVQPLTSPWTGTNVQLNQTTVIISYTVFYKQAIDVLASAKELGLINPATIAWELMPWSFVIDWFIPIGDWVSSLDATAGLKFATGCVSTKQIIENTAIRSGEIRNSSSYTQSYSSGTYKKTTFTRSPLLTMPFALYTDFKNPFTPTHWANAAALLSQARSSVPRYTPKSITI